MTRPRPTVALIGCGASGMCFLHALATRQQRDGDTVVLPHVICFERADEPGGCWRSPSPDERDQPHNVSCWHDDIWNNIAKESFEFSDYTFKEHFKGKPVPTFLPRSVLLDYLVKRTERVDPKLYQLTNGTKSSSHEQLHEMRFGTIITHVRFDDETNKFEVGSAKFDPVAQNEGGTEPEKIEYFDYCIWAAGLRGKPRIPRYMVNLLHTGGAISKDGTEQDNDSPPTPFSGTVLHSLNATHGLEDVVKEKRVVLIGDSNTAEELALRSVRFGVEKCYILSRSGFGDCAYMGSWPCTKDPTTGKLIPKVEVHVVIPYRITGDGRTIKCATMEWNPEEEVYEIDEEGDFITLTDIDTIVICTGYVPNMEFLSEDLNIHSEQLASWYWSVPLDFKMRENALTPEVGEVEPDDVLNFSGNFVPGMYRTVLINNPRMMYIMDIKHEFPLLRLEAMAWLCLSFITGEVSIPAKEEIEPKILHEMVEEMHIAYLRWSMDRNYFCALDELSDDHWTDDYNDPRSMELNLELLRHYAGVLARDFKDAKYPVDFGSYGNLSKRGDQLVDLGMQNILMRHLLDKSSDEALWKTFRDVDPAPFRSLYSSQVAAPLPGRWLELKASDVEKKIDHL